MNTAGAGGTAVRRPLVALVAGFSLSATIFYALIHLVGRFLFDWIPAPLIVFAVVTVVFLVVDSGLLGLRTPMWRRQTPQQHFFRFGVSHGAFRWGLDTGLVVTTFRVTSLTWVSLTAVLLGLVPWWAGILYAVGFLVPSVVLIAVVPFRPDRPGRPEPVWLNEKVSDFAPYLRIAAKIAFAGAALASVAVAVS